MDYIQFVKTKGVEDLKEMIQKSGCRSIYLMDFHVFDPEDLSLNAKVFLWPKNILHVFQLSDEVRILMLKNGFDLKFPFQVQTFFFKVYSRDVVFF